MKLFKIYCLSLLALILSTAALSAADKPNIVFIFADDMGVGDVSHNGGKAPTPHIDRLAAEGIRFTDAHTTSSVCTPSRYGLLTGRYNWRTHLQKSVFFNPHDMPLIAANQSTVASLLKESGYHTGCVGKWHLGIGWQFLEDYNKSADRPGQGWDIDYSKPAVTPLAYGFDYFFGIQASLDMAPYVYIENELATATATVTKAFFRKGAAAADFEAVNCLRDFASKSVTYIDQRAQTPDQPFFLYLPLTSPHTPIVPSESWKGKSSIGDYGDFIMESDWVVGQVLEALDKHDMTKDTIVFFSTDNGCSPAAKIDQLVEKGHKPNGDLRGHKADIYEGGHRVPFLVRWPGVIKSGSTTDRLTSLSDVYATTAEIVGAKGEADDGVDSISFLPTLKGEQSSARSAVVHHSIGGFFAIREGDWKLCFCPGSGGWSAPRPGKAGKDAPAVQLFNLTDDPAEKNNVESAHPEKVKHLTALLQSYIDNGRSTEGTPQMNDASIVVLK
ncbi:MAG: arylsulfatase A [Verrucomicrobiales bacterium]|jgi:arylsulfatase A